MEINFFRPFQRGRAVRRMQMNDSSSEESWDDATVIVMEGPLPSRPVLSYKEMATACFKKEVPGKVVNSVVLDYFITEGLLEEAVIFAGEAGLDVHKSVNLKFSEFRLVVKNDLFGGNWDALVDKLTSFCFGFWVDCPHLLLDVRALQLETIAKEGKGDMTGFLRDKMFPIAHGISNSAESQFIRDKIEAIVAKILLFEKVDAEIEVVWDQIDGELSRHFPESCSNGLQHFVNCLFNLQKVMRGWVDVPLVGEDEVFQLSKLLANKGKCLR